MNDLFTNPVAMHLAGTFLGLLIGLAFAGWFYLEYRSARSEKRDLEKSHGELSTKHRKLELHQEALQSAHYYKCVKPAADDLLRVIKNKPNSRPADQVNVFLTSLVALFGNEGLLNNVRSYLGTEFNKSHSAEEVKSGEKSRFIQLTWTYDEKESILTYLLNWTGLDSPFPVVVQL